MVVQTFESDAPLGCWSGHSPRAPDGNSNPTAETDLLKYRTGSSLKKHLASEAGKMKKNKVDTVRYRSCNDGRLLFLQAGTTGILCAAVVVL